MDMRKVLQKPHPGANSTFDPVLYFGNEVCGSRLYPRGSQLTVTVG